MESKKEELIRKLKPLLDEYHEYLYEYPKEGKENKEGTDDDEYLHNLFQRIERLTPDPEVMDYINISHEYVDESGRVLLEKLVDKLLEYKIIIL